MQENLHNIVENGYGSDQLIHDVPRRNPKTNGSLIRPSADGMVVVELRKMKSALNDKTADYINSNNPDYKNSKAADIKEMMICMDKVPISIEALQNDSRGEIKGNSRVPRDCHGNVIRTRNKSNLPPVNMNKGIRNGGFFTKCCRRP